MIPDSSPRTCGGVGYSFEDFFRRMDFEGFDLPSWPMGYLGRVVIPLCCDRTPWEHLAMGFGGLEKISLDSDPSLGSDRSAIIMRPCIRFPCESNFPRAPARSKGPIEGSAHLVIVLPQAFFDKMVGLSRALFSSMDKSWCSVSY